MNSLLYIEIKEKWWLTKLFMPLVNCYVSVCSFIGFKVFPGKFVAWVISKGFTYGDIKSKGSL
jgi:hypothetical protein